MPRRVFFSFDYTDVWRANVVRNSWVGRDREAAGFFDAAEREQVQRQGDLAIQRWIDRQMANTSVTVVLVGQATNLSRWVRYEINQSVDLGKGLLEVSIARIGDQLGLRAGNCGKLVPWWAPTYCWVADNGYRNFRDWVEIAAQAAQRPPLLRR